MKEIYEKYLHPIPFNITSRVVIISWDIQFLLQ